MADPKPGDPGNQEWLNQQIAAHDKSVKHADDRASTVNDFFAGAHAADADLKKDG